MTASAAPADDDEMAIGSVLDGRYRIEAILGAGGMGRVYRGEHVSLGRQVAIKVLHADLARNKEAAQRFQREALASGRLEHPNIVGVSDFGIVENGPCYLVMEVLEGEPLGTLLGRKKRLGWREASRIMRGVLAGLHHAHERGVVHRDIKPDNVFLANKDGETVVKILDFGIAKLYAGSPDDPASTRAGLTVGTPAYLSPEQAVGGEIKPASDIYSATILLFEMLTGQPPFDEKEPLAMLGAHVSATPPTVKQIAPDVTIPAELEALIQHGLVKLQANRISSAAEYIARLEAIERLPDPDASIVLLTQPVVSGSAPTESLTPVPTPMPTAQPAPVGGDPTSPAVPASDPALGFLSGPVAPQTLAEIRSATPLPKEMNDATTPQRPMALARTTQPVALAEPAAIPRNWIKVGAIAFGAILVIGLIVAIASTGGDSKKKSPPRKPEKTESTKAKAAPPPEPERKPDPPARTVEKILAPPIEVKPEESEPSTELKALLHDLQTGKTCAARKAAIPKLVELGDKAAIEPLKKARYRGYGGVLGIGEKNANHCLVKAANAAIEKLGGSVK